MGDLDRCLATARRFGVTDPVVVHGAQNIVLVGDSSVLRFPRHRADARRIEEIFTRHVLAHRLALAPHAPARFAAGSVGVAHLELLRLDGTPLPLVLTDPSADLPAVAESLTESLARTRRVLASQWPFPQRDWVQLWADLPRRAHARSATLPAAALADWVVAAERAAEVAATAPLGLMHGDLQGHNVLVGPDGTVSAVLDWDTALIGDPAMDTAAALHDFPAPVRREVVSRHEWVAADLERFAVYRGTWALQAALWEAGERSVTPLPPGGTGR